MKDNIANVLEDFEKLAYKILMWVILVPKTIVKVVVDPGFVPEYIRGELKAEKGKQFDEYISPMLLYLGVTLLPAIAIYLLPAFGMKVLSPYDDPALYYDAFVETEQGVFSVNDPAVSGVASPVTGVVQQEAPIGERTFLGHSIDFRVELKTRADTSQQWHRFRWDVSECGNQDPYLGTCKFDVYYYGEIHDEQFGTACIYGTVFEGVENPNCLASPKDDPTDQQWSSFAYTISFPEKSFEGNKNNRNLVSDYFSLFYRPNELEQGEGVYQIKISAVTRSLSNPAIKVETDEVTLDLITYAFSSEFSINPYSGYSTPDDSDRRYTFINFLGFNFNPEKDGEGESRSLADRLESGETIAFGLGLLLPPLLIAGAIGIFKGLISFVDEGGSVIQKSSIGEEALKENFYAQCYYFVPVGLSFWAWYYSLNFHTNDIQYRAEWLWIPLALALVWFFIVEIISIADELLSKSRPKALFILFGCIVVMFLVVRLGQAFSYNFDWLRKSAVWSYPGVALFLLLGVIYFQFIKRRRDKKGAKVNETD
jgi:hypothetical protein